MSAFSLHRRAFNALLAAVTACAVVLLPAMAAALPLWDGAEICSDGVLEYAPEAETPGCDGVSPDDPSYNVCFEDAEAPISSFPELIAEMRAERLSNLVATRALEIQDTQLVSTELAVSESEEILDIEPIKPPQEEPACSSYSVRCGALPAIPLLVMVDAAANGFPIPETAFDVPAQPKTAQKHRLTPRQGLGPAHGYGEPLVPPPRLA